MDEAGLSQARQFPEGVETQHHLQVPALPTPQCWNESLDCSRARRRKERGAQAGGK